MPKAPKTKLDHTPPAKPKGKSSHPSKEVMIAILLARLDCTKSFDWHELSLKLNCPADENDYGSKKKGKAKGKGVKNGDEKGQNERGMSGTELRDVYQDIILPTLRQGVMPWDREVSADTNDSTPPPLTPSSVSAGLDLSEAPKNNKSMVLKSKKLGSTKGKGKGKGKKAEEEEAEESMAEYESEEEEMGEASFEHKQPLNDSGDDDVC